MVGQAAKAADMRAGAVPKPGMKAMNGGGGSVSRSTQKYVAPAPEKPKSKPKAASHSQMVAQWEANGRDADGKLIKHVEKKKELTKEEVNRLRDRALEEKRRAATVVTTTGRTLRTRAPTTARRPARPKRKQQAAPVTTTTQLMCPTAFGWWTPPA